MSPAPDDTRTPPWALRLIGLCRRMFVRTTGIAVWGVDGHDDETRDNVETFQNIGFSSRPIQGSDGAEVIVLRVGAAESHPVIVATRDVSIEVELDEDETAIFNSTCIVKIKKNGEIEIGSKGGTFSSLGFQADVAAIMNVLKTWTPVANDGGQALKTAAGLLSDPVGTAKLKAE